MGFNLYNQDKKSILPTRVRPPHLDAPENYIPSEGLINAVNVALTLQQPLLLTGEPGTGKTKLADHIAYIFDLGNPLVFNAKTTSNVKDLFYKYDALGHFQFSQTSKVQLKPDEIENAYIKYEALGVAIKSENTKVVLIDEIDKAPRDFPNDILAELENLTFNVPEINKSYAAPKDQLPIIIMTSNSEKNLPDAFLRRVTFYHIPFPTTEQLLNILQLKFNGYKRNELLVLVEYFNWLRTEHKFSLQKKPATAELIYWTQLLKELNFNVFKLKDLNTLTATEKKQLMFSFSVLAKTKEDLALLNHQIIVETE